MISPIFPSREKILKNFRSMEEHKQEQMRESLRKKLSGKTKLKSAVVMKRWLEDVLAQRSIEGEPDPTAELPYVIDTRMVQQLSVCVEEELQTLDQAW